MKVWTEVEAVTCRPRYLVKIKRDDDWPATDYWYVQNRYGEHNETKTVTYRRLTAWGASRCARRRVRIARVQASRYRRAERFARQWRPQLPAGDR